MGAKWDFLGEISQEQLDVMAADTLATTIQLAIQKSMARKGITQKELAERLKISPARVSQLLSAHGSNMTLKTIGRIANAIDEEFEFLALQDVQELKSKSSTRASRHHRHVDNVVFGAWEIEESPWTDQSSSANENWLPELFTKARAA